MSGLPAGLSVCGGGAPPVRGYMVTHELGLQPRSRVVRDGVFRSFYRIRLHEVGPDEAEVRRQLKF